ncbi:MAG: hypothetical protein ABEI27_13625 [Halobellus sp.]
MTILGDADDAHTVSTVEEPNLPTHEEQPELVLAAARDTQYAGPADTD